MTQARCAGIQALPATRRTEHPVRTASLTDLHDIVAIHQKAFREFFLTRMGDEILRRYYQLVLDYQAGIVLVGEGQDGVAGFACGFVDPAAFYKLLRRNACGFVLPALGAVARAPSLVTGILRGLERIRRAASRDEGRDCELSSIAVAPEEGRGGLGTALAHAFVQRAWSMNATGVCLSTDAHANDAANAFYQKAGFQRTRQFFQYKDRWMNEYRIGRMGASGDAP